MTAATALAVMIAGIVSVPARGAALFPVPAAPFRQVSYLGYHIQVPASWKIVNLVSQPSACVRFDRHAVYLGSPGPAQRCPAHLIAAKTESLLIQPLGMTAAPSGTAADSVAREYVVIDRGAGVKVTAAYGADQALIRNILAGARTSPAGDPREPQRARLRAPVTSQTPVTSRAPAAPPAPAAPRVAAAAPAAPPAPASSRPVPGTEPPVPGTEPPVPSTEPPVPSTEPPGPGAMAPGPDTEPLGSGAAVSGTKPPGPGAVAPVPATSAAPSFPVDAPPIAGAAPSSPTPALPTPAPPPTPVAPPSVTTTPPATTAPSAPPITNAPPITGTAPPLTGAAAAAATSATGLGFDTCTAPSQAAMDAWLARSPYRAVGVYIGGADRACAQPSLTPAWISRQVASGWHLIPLYVGPQAEWRQITAPAVQGIGAADDAAVQAEGLGLGTGALIYYDMEAYPARQRAAALNFLAAWTSELHRLGFASGVYSSSASGVADLVNHYASYPMPDVIFDALWNGAADTEDPMIPDPDWADHQRAHQYSGPGSFRYGRYKLNIDRDYLDVAPPAAGSLWRVIRGS